MDRFSDFNFPSDDFVNWLNERLPPSHETAVDDFAFANVLTLLENRLGAKYVLCEENYIDADYQSLSSCWYSKSFRQLPNLCCRVHFSTEQINQESILSGNYSEESYLGYCVLTPLTTGRVGRTVVRPWSTEIDLCGDRCHPYFLRAPSPVHLYGNKLQASGTPYMSQDAMVMVCAQAAIWMALNYMHFRFSEYGLKRILPDEITGAATENLSWGGRLLPSGGLTLQHIANALSNLGYSPIFDTQPDDDDSLWNPINWIIKYIDSDIPVILALRRPPHAIVAVGSLFGKGNYVALPDDNQLVSIDNWVSGIIVNDDNLGPYKIMPRHADSLPALSQNYADLLPPEGTWQSLSDVLAVFVPLPQEVSIQARHVDALVFSQIFSIDKGNIILSAFIANASNDNNPQLEYFLGVLFDKVPEERIVTRAYLIRSMEFLNRLDKEEDCPEMLWKYYKKQQYPTYIWIVELFLQSEVQSTTPKERLICGEIILDSTANRYDPCWLFVHINGYIAKRNVQSEAIEFYTVGDVVGYKDHKSNDNV